jgi:hypothetical protein
MGGSLARQESRPPVSDSTDRNDAVGEFGLRDNRTRIGRVFAG